MGLRESPRYLTRQDVSLVHTLPTLSLGHLAGWWPEEVEGRGQGGRHPTNAKAIAVTCVTLELIPVLIPSRISCQVQKQFTIYPILI